MTDIRTQIGEATFQLTKLRNEIRELTEKILKTCIVDKDLQREDVEDLVSQINLTIEALDEHANKISLLL